MSWWSNAAVYQIYIRSYCDSDADGVGDLEGIRSRLRHIAELGADALWITPFYPSPMADHGYDVADYCDVDRLFGDLTSFDKLLVDAHGLGLRVLVDLVPNHTSSAHPWFVRALEDPSSPERDYYLFRPAKPNGSPPNNWESVFGGPAWSWDAASGEYFLHLFDSTQPDLNWRNPAVHAEWERILTFWLDRGVDGFRIDVAHGLYKAAGLPDAIAAQSDDPRAPHLHAIGVKPCWDQPEVLDVYRRWRAIAERYEDRMLVGEVFLWDTARVAAYCGPTLLHQAFNFPVAGAAFDADSLAWTIRAALEVMPTEGAVPTWVLSNHDLVRHATRFGGGELGRRCGLAVTALLAALPGALYLYQGEELGAEQVDVPPSRRQDPIHRRSGGAVAGRDGCRTPMPWTAEPPGFGFTQGTSWLPFAPDAETRNVASLAADPCSILAAYQALLAARRATRGRLADRVEWLDPPGGCLALRRAGLDAPSLAVITNTRSSAVGVPLPGAGEIAFATEAGASVGPGHVRVPAQSTVWLSLP